MNDVRKAPHEAALIERALAAFTRTTGLEARITAYEPMVAHDRGVDAFIEVKVADRAIDFVVEVKANLDRAVTLVGAQQQLAPYGDRALLIAPYVTAELATVCREKLHLQFMDAAGNAFVDRPGIFVFAKGERLTDARVPDGKGGTATRLRTVFALLCQPALVDAPYRVIAEAAGVALGTVGWVFYDLNIRGFIAGGKRAHARRLLEHKRLLDEWVTNYAIKLRPKLNPQRFRAPDADWWRNTKLDELRAYWGGEVAADRLTNYLKPAKFTIYADPATRQETVAKLATTHRFRADPDGNIEILDTFWHFPAETKHPDVVPPILAYADLLATLDPRNIEAAAMIREQYIDNALRTT